MNKKKKKLKKINSVGFFTLTKKYFWDQLILYFLTVLSAFFSSLVDKNVTNIIDTSKANNGVINFSYFKYKFIKFDLNQGLNNQFFYFLAFSTLIFVWCAIVYYHVNFAENLFSKISYDIKSEMLRKNLFLKSNNISVNSIISKSVSDFSSKIFFIPNQIFYSILSILFSIYLQGKDHHLKHLIIAAIVFFVISSPLYFEYYRREKEVQKKLERETFEEISLVEYSPLIVKKSMIIDSLNSYFIILRDGLKSINRRNSAKTASFVFSSYFFPKIVVFIFFCLFKFSPSYIILVNSVAGDLKKVSERCKDFSACISSKDEINHFLSLPERNDQHFGLIINEKIKKISLYNINFSYSNKKVFENFSITFSPGSINYLNYGNGFGKSTLINLIMGIDKISSGKIIINDFYSLDEINLLEWRKKISYSSHKNLIRRKDLSTGQLQMLDIMDSINNTNSSIFVFDEASSNLDVDNKNKFLDLITNLANNKIVIVIEHSK